jgi:beta-glucosidase
LLLAWYSDAIVFKRYPEDGLKIVESEMPVIKAGDMDTIGQPLDFYGVNIYNGYPAGGSPWNYPKAPDMPLTAYYWPVIPESLYWGTKFTAERYGLPVYVTENGMSCLDWVALDGKVHDPQRIDFLSRYLAQLQRAIREGVDVRGYFQWSLLDNFEWAEGYRQRFGLIFTEFATQRRIPKDSAEFFRKVALENAVNVPEPGDGLG